MSFQNKVECLQKELLSMKLREQLGPFRVTGGHERSEPKVGERVSFILRISLYTGK
jgi:hypothetical protein